MTPENYSTSEVSQLHQKISLFIEQQQWEQAILCCHQALKNYPQEAKFYYFLGKVLSQQGQWQTAIFYYKKAILLNPNSTVIYRTLGDALTHIKQWEYAIHCYLKSIQINPKVCWSYFKLADAYGECKQWEKAVIAYRQGLSLHPKNYWAYLKLGNALVEQQQEEEAIKAYHQALQLHPNEETIYYNLGKIYKTKKDWNNAIKSFIKALQIKPDLISAYHQLAEIFDDQKQPENAYTCRQHKCLPSDTIQKFLQLQKDWSIQPDVDPFIRLYKAEVSVHPLDIETFFVAEVSKGRVWGDLANSVVINSKNQVINAFSTGCSELVISSQKLPNPIELDETIAFLSVRWGQDYFHWMLDILPQFYLIKKAKLNIKFEEIDKFIINSQSYNFHQETLNKLGINPQKIITSQDYPHLKATRIIVPTPLCKTQSRIPAWACNFLRYTILSHQTLQTIQQTNRIYISRDLADSRKIINQDSVQNLLEPYHFKTVYLEQMKVEEQALLFAGAAIIVAPHGAALTNLIFCQSHTKVIEIFSPNYTPPLYQMICKIYNLEYCSLLGTPLPNILSIERKQDIWVDCNQLQKILLKMLE